MRSMHRAPGSRSEHPAGRGRRQHRLVHVEGPDCRGSPRRARVNCGRRRGARSHLRLRRGPARPDASRRSRHETPWSGSARSSPTRRCSWFRAGRHRRQGGLARRRRQRLPHQAVRVRRARGPRTRAHARRKSQTPPSDVLRAGRPGSWTPRPASRSAEAHPQRGPPRRASSRCWSTSCATKDRCSRRQQLLNAVWGFDFDTDSNVVDVYVSYLRRKLDQGDGPSIIETVRGAGYRVRA